MHYSQSSHLLASWAFGLFSNNYCSEHLWIILKMITSIAPDSLLRKEIDREPKINRLARYSPNYWKFTLINSKNSLTFPPVITISAARISAAFPIASNCPANHSRPLLESRSTKKERREIGLACMTCKRWVNNATETQITLRNDKFNMKLFFLLKVVGGFTKWGSISPYG